LLSIQSNIGEVAGRAFVDSAPFWIRAWAAKGGLGWIGKKMVIYLHAESRFILLHC
jgi:epoxyqueuosine reductase QueG